MRGVCRVEPNSREIIIPPPILPVPLEIFPLYQALNTTLDVRSRSGKSHLSQYLAHQRTVIRRLPSLHDSNYGGVYQIKTISIHRLVCLGPFLVGRCILGLNVGYVYPASGR